MTDGTGGTAPARTRSYGDSAVETPPDFPRTNWAGNVIFGAERTHVPDSIDRLCEIVGGSSNIRVLGRGHSFNAIADTPGDLVSLGGLPMTVDVDSANSTVTVSAQTSYTELARELHRAGYALANMASISEISLAGACATGTHGSGDDQQVLASSVNAMQVVAADGGLLELRRDAGGDSFCGSVVTLGALGIVTKLTLDIEPAYDMWQTVYVGVSLDEIQDRLDDVFSAGYSVSVFTDWESGKARVWIKRRIDRPVSEWTASTEADRDVHPVSGRSSELCTPQLGVVGPWHERLAHFRPRSTTQAGQELQSELFVPRASGRQAMSALRELAGVLAPALLVSEIRTIRADDLWMSPAYDRDSLAFHFTWNDDESSVLTAIGAIEDQLLPLDPRPHWGKITLMDPRTIITSYRRAPDFERLMVEHDPTLKFRNAFVNRLFPLP